MSEATYRNLVSYENTYEHSDSSQKTVGFFSSIPKKIGIFALLISSFSSPSRVAAGSELQHLVLWEDKADPSFEVESSFSVISAEARNALVGYSYSESDTASLFSFLSKNSIVVSYLTDARKLIKEYFPDSNLTLRFDYDHEASNPEYKTLFVAISTKRPLLEVNSAFRKINEVLFVEKDIDPALFNLTMDF